MSLAAIEAFPAQRRRIALDAARETLACLDALNPGPALKLADVPAARQPFGGNLTRPLSGQPPRNQVRPGLMYQRSRADGARLPRRRRRGTGQPAATGR